MDYCKALKITCAILVSFCLHTAHANSLESWQQAEKSCQAHKVFCHILKLRPKIDKAWAFKFSNLLYKYGKQYKMDPMRSLAIAMQETSLKNKHRSRKVIVFKESCKDNHCKKSYQTIEGFSDLSIFQFHVNTIKYFNIDPIKLNQSLEYVVASHFKILKHKQERCAYLKVNAWACYHSKTPKYRKKYIKMVNRWYPKLSKKSARQNIHKIHPSKSL